MIRVGGIVSPSFHVLVKPPRMIRSSAAAAAPGRSTTGAWIGNDCIVAGATAATTNKIDGGKGIDVRIAPAAANNKFTVCETTG